MTWHEVTLDPNGGTNVIAVHLKARRDTLEGA
jgi:hypothetical protein